MLRAIDVMSSQARSKKESVAILHFMISVNIPESHGQIGLSAARRSSTDSTDSVLVGRSLYCDMASDSLVLSVIIRLRILCRCLLRSADKETSNFVIQI